MTNKSFYWNDRHHNFQTFMFDNLNTKYMEEKKIRIEIAGDISDWKCLLFHIKFIGYNYFYEKLYEISNIIFIDDDNGNINQNLKDKIIYNIDINTIDKNLYLKDRYDNGNVEYYISSIYEFFVDKVPLVVSKEENDKKLKNYILVRKIEKLWEKYWFEPYEYKIIDGKKIAYTRSILSKYKEMQKLMNN